MSEFTGVLEIDGLADIGFILKRITEQRFLEAKRVASEIGISHSQLNLIESNKYKSLQCNVLFKILNYYNIKIVLFDKRLI